MSFRRFPSEYVSKHLHGLSVHSTLPSNNNNDNNMMIATHSGSFHCDEALACSLLRHTSIGKTASVVRSRDMNIINACNMAVDVGAVYDPSTHRYDHHQQSFHDTMRIEMNSFLPAVEVKEYHTRLSSAGLVYKHFGREVIQNFVEAAVQQPQLRQMLQWSEEKTKLSERELDVIYVKMYENFVEQVDGIDNGVECFSAQLISKKGENAGQAVQNNKECEEFEAVLKKNYQQTTSLSSRVGSMAAWWNEPKEEEGENKEEKENLSFVQAVELTGTEFFEKLFFYVFSWLPARSLVEEAYKGRFNIEGGDAEGRIVLFQNSFCPWKDHLSDIEEEERKANNNNNTNVTPILYVIFSDGKGWRVQAVSKELGSFESRKPLPFKGLRDEELSAASGIDGGVFVHVSGFIGGMKTLEGALALARKAIEA